MWFGFVFCECTRPTARIRQTCFLFLSTGTGRRYEYLQHSSMFTLVHNTDAEYVCLDVLLSRYTFLFSPFLWMVSIGQTTFFCSDRFSLPVMTPRALTVSKHLARPGEVNNYELHAGGITCTWEIITGFTDVRIASPLVRNIEKNQ